MFSPRIFSTQERNKYFSGSYTQQVKIWITTLAHSLLLTQTINICSVLLKTASGFRPLRKSSHIVNSNFQELQLNVDMRRTYVRVSSWYLGKFNFQNFEIEVRNFKKIMMWITGIRLRINEQCKNILSPKLKGILVRIKVNVISIKYVSKSIPWYS